MIAILRKNEGVLGPVIQTSGLFVALVLGHYLAALLAAQFAGLPVAEGILAAVWWRAVTLCSTFVVLLIIWHVVWMARTVRPEHPSPWRCDAVGEGRGLSVANF